MASAAETPAWAGHLLARSRFHTADLLADASLPGRLVRRWGERPSWRQLQDVDGTWIESDELEQRTRAGAQRLRAAGLQPGDRFVLSAGSSARLVVAYVAALRAGLVVVPLNTAYTRVEVERIVRDAQPAAAAVEDSERAGWIRDCTAGSAAIIDLTLEGVRDRDDTAIDEAVSADPALLVYTSGTTGRPKGALLTHGNLLASATAVEIAWRWETEDRLLLALPLFHVHGLGVGINGSLCAGGSIVLRPRFDASDVAEHSSAGGRLDVLRRPDDVPATGVVGDGRLAQPSAAAGLRVGAASGGAGERGRRARRGRSRSSATG